MQNVMTRLDSLNLVDKFLFDETFESAEAYSAAISILLEDEIELLNRPQTEKELRVSPQLRQVRLDVVGMDSKQKLYYTEMQKRDTKNLVRRSRYYQAQLDVSLLEPGCIDFNRLNDTCFILIAPFDIFGKGLYRYTFEGTCRECPELKLQDGATRVFINTRGTNGEAFSQEFLDFMTYLTETTGQNAENSNSDRIRTIHKNVCRIKDSEKMGVKYMQTWEEKILIRQAGKEEGRVEGKIESRREDIISLLEELGELSEELREIIEKEKEENVLKEWLKQAARAGSVEEFALHMERRNISAKSERPETEGLA